MTTEAGLSRPMTAELKRAGRKLARARSAADAALMSARDVGMRAMAEGYPEATAARLLGVDRMTVRKWAGK